MRLQQLHLLRYGKFTDQTLDFPPAPQDFHLIVGANEAGKSTTRGAILDLLFGIEMRSTLDFLHAKADMRLGATLEHNRAVLAFTRTKSPRKSLFGLTGAALADDALAPFLAGSDRAFFDQMFGLDHGRLVAGGRAILNATDDIGEILFQSAAGIASLGQVRDQLAAEADTLWAKRRANDRAYYIASDELVAAEKALKDVTVRTKDWLEARTAVQALEARRAALRERAHGVEAERIRLERVRRVAPALRQWQQAQAELARLAHVVRLPADAAQQWAAADVELAAAQLDAQRSLGLACEVGARLALIRIDASVLAHATEIQALTERRQQVQPHAREIERDQAELNVHWQQALALAGQLGWAAQASCALTADALAARLPTLLERAALTSLAQRSGVVAQAQQNAALGVAEKCVELETLNAQLSGLLVHAVAPALRVALQAARALGDVDGAAARDAALVAKGQREWTVAVAVAALVGPGEPAVVPAPAPDLGALRRLVLPSEPEIARLQQRASVAEQKRELQLVQGAQLRADLQAQQLAIQQYREAHHPVSAAELAQVRSERDTRWQQIKAGMTSGVHAGLAPAPTLAAGFEASVAKADTLADQRHAKAREVSELQVRQHALERLTQELDAHAARHIAQADDAAASATHWAQLTAALGLAGLALHAFEPWRAARDKALRADDALRDAQHGLDATRLRTQTAGAALRAALAGADIPLDASFGTLVLMAADAVDGASDAQARRDATEAQRAQAGAALARQQQRHSAAQAEAQAWTRDWQAATLQAGLCGGVSACTDTGPAISPAAADAALAVMAQIDIQLLSIHEIRQNRIDAKQHALRDFAQDVAVLCASLTPATNAAGDAVDPAGAAVALLALAERLGQARSDAADAGRLTTQRDQHASEAAQAQVRVDHALATLRPLRQLAQVGEDAELPALIDLSDRLRGAEAAARAGRLAVEEGGDGLAPDALQAEAAALQTRGEGEGEAGAAAVCAADIPLRINELARQLDAVRQQQDALGVELAHAGTALAAIQGQDAAARAESQRQDALAKMANAAERYIKVHTASRLLKWAIDRYRETRQGPMLTRAGEIFAALTLGSFGRLSVDYDSDPLALHGLRADGARVPIPGMSDGTRDQLYLALRLAALELHLSTGTGNGDGDGDAGAVAGHPLPFIADDLFINYDDRRARAGLEALAQLSQRTQVVFLSHHDHLVPTVQAVFGAQVNVIRL